MNIAIVLKQFIIGGAEQYVITKAQWLVDRGHSVIVISEGGIWEKKLPTQVTHFKYKGISHSPYSMNPQYYNQFLQGLADIFIANSIDVIEGHEKWPIMHVINSYYLHKKAYCMNILLELAYNNNYLLQLATKKLEKSRRYYTLTPKMNSYIEHKCSKHLNAKIIRIPVHAIRDIPIVDDKFILSVCRMSPEKMYVKCLIENFANLIMKEKHIQHTLKLVGDGPLFNEVLDIANHYNEKIGQKRIIMYGFLEGEELNTLFASCSLYVGMGTTLLTAASLAKPCIRCGFESSTMSMAWGFWGEDPETDKDEIVYASVSESSRKETFESIINRAFSKDNLLEDMGNKAHELYNSNYSLDTIMTQWELEYSKISSKTDDINELIDLSKRSIRLSSLLHIFYEYYHGIKKIYSKINAFFSKTTCKQQTI